MSMNRGQEFLTALSRIPGVLLAVPRLLRALREICRAIWQIITQLRRRHWQLTERREECDKRIPPEIYKRPDPLLYAQYYLMSMGLAVTWDNPDIQVFEVDASKPNGVGAPVPPSALVPNHPYKVVVRVWNGSYDAPAVGLPIHLSYLSFGAGTVTHGIATTHVNLGVKGSSEHPAFGFFDWTTPAAAGHYCLQALLEWWDDANPNNNLGQKNLNVGVAHSPAEFTFTLHNAASVRRRFVVEVDTYRLPTLPDCEEQPDPRNNPNIAGRATVAAPMTRIAESRVRWAATRQTQSYGSFPVPEDWTVVIDPSELVIAAGEDRDIHVSIEPKTENVQTPKAFNLHAFALLDDNTRSLVGGVTLYVTKS